MSFLGDVLHLPQLIEALQHHAVTHAMHTAARGGDAQRAITTSRLKGCRCVQ